MKLAQLRYFLAAIEEGSVARAAARCNVAQPSVAEAIRNLEAELRVTLFERSRRGLRPTEVARDLFPRARRLLEDADAIATAMRRTNRTRVNLYLHPTIANHRVARLLSDFARRDIVDVRLTDEQEADVVVGPDDQMADSRELWREDYRLAIPRHHPLATRDRIALGDLKGQRFVARCSCERASAFPTEMLQPDIVAVAENEDRALALVAAGLGLCVIPGLPEECEDIVVRSLGDFSLSRTIAIEARTPHGRDIVKGIAE